MDCYCAGMDFCSVEKDSARLDNSSTLKVGPKLISLCCIKEVTI